MLNGSESQSSQSRTEGGGTTTTTRTLRTGYISRECFAFVYRLVCAMRGIPFEQLLLGLSESARREVLECERRYANWFSSEYCTPVGAASLAAELQDTVVACQDEAAARHRTIRRVKEKLGALRTGINASHKELLEAQQQIEKLFQPKPNPHPSFLKCLESRDYVAERTSRCESQIRNLSLEWKQVESVDSSIRHIRHESESEVVECPLDGTKLRVPMGRKRLLVTCSSCRYKFLVSTEAGLMSVLPKSGGVSDGGED